MKLALIGTGHAGQKHLDALRAFDFVEVVCVCDPVATTAAAHLKRYADVEEMLEREKELDVVLIASPNGLHEEQALRCLEYGCHVIVEKPLAIRARGAQKIIEAAANRQMKVFCVMQNRYSPVMQWLEKLLVDGWLDEPFLIQINCFWNRDDRYYLPGSWRGKGEMDGGPLFTQFSHFIDALLWLFGDVDTVEGAYFDNVAHQHNTDYEDTGVVVLKMANQARATLHYTTAVPRHNAASSLTILAKTGAVKIAGQYMNEVAFYNLPPGCPEPPTAAPPAANDRIPALAAFFQHLKDPHYRNYNAREALKVVDLIETIYHKK